MTELAQVVGEDAEHLWMAMDLCKVYMKHGKPYGVIGVMKDESTDMLVIYSMALNDGKFTNGMLKDIIKMYRQSNITLITDREYAFEYINKALEPYGFQSFVIDSSTGSRYLYNLHYRS